MRSRPPSPALAVAFIALVAALGGSAFAEQRQERRAAATARVAASKVLKPGTLTERQVRAASLTGRSIRNGTLTGVDVDETSLGTVPSAAVATAATRAARADQAGTAAQAGSATTAGRADSAARADTASRAETAARADVAAVAEALDAPQVKPTRVAPGQQVVLAQEGPWTIRARCDAGGGGQAADDVIARLEALPSTGGLVASSNDGGTDAGLARDEPFILTTTVTSLNVGHRVAEAYADNDFTLFATDGTVVVDGQALSGARVFEAPACVFAVRLRG